MMNLNDMGFEKEREEYIRSVCICFNAIHIVDVDVEFKDIKKIRNILK